MIQPIWSSLTRSAILANSSGQSMAGVVPLKSSKVSLAMRVSPERLFCTFLAWTLAMMPPRMTSVFSGRAASSATLWRRQGLEQARVPRQGMAGHIKAERLFFVGQELGVGHLRDVGQVHRGGAAVAVGMAIVAGRFELVEEAALTAAPIVLLGLARLNRPRQHAQELTAQQIGLAGVEAIERPRPDQRLGAAGADVPGRRPARRSRPGSGTGPSARAP